MNENNQLVLSCDTGYIVNDEHVFASVTYAHSVSSLYVCGKVFPLNLLIIPTQSTIDGMIYILENLNICKGIQITDNRHGCEKWSNMRKNDFLETRIRHTNCKILLSFIFKNNFCSVCQKKENRLLKRHLNESAELTVQKNPKLDQADNSDDTTGKGLTEKMELFSEMQKKNSRHGMDKRRRRWEPEFISLCLSLYLRSPKAYEDLRKSDMLILPTERLLRMYKNCVKQKPGINSDNFQWMNKEATKQNLSQFAKRGGIVIDEMSLQDDIQIVRKGDAWSLVGAVDMGETNNNIAVITKKEKRVQLATHSLQFIFHGFTGFRWPIAYYGSNPATTHQLYVNFWESIDALDENGFVVDYVMFDGASSNRSFMNMLLCDDPRAQNFIAKDIYDKDHQIFVIQDVKHVIKKLRNNIEASKREHKASAGRYLVLNGKPIVWNQFEEVFEFNVQKGFRIHRKLTKEHLELTSASKMRNHLAEEVLNKDMLFLFKSYQATLDVPERLASTILLLENTSVLVDIFRDTRPIIEKTDTRLTQLDAVLSFFNKWEETISQTNLYTTSKHLFPQETRDDLNSCISGFSAMCQTLLGAGNSITPAYLNADVIENHFCQQRGVCNGLNTNPTLAQYGPSNTSICLGQRSLSSKGNSSTKASFYSATTPCALNKRRSKASNKISRKLTAKK